MPLRLFHPPGSPGAHSWASDFQTQLVKQYAALGIPRPPTVSELVSARAHPELLIYFATSPWSATSDPSFADELGRYADEALHLLPVIDHETDAGTHLAPALQRFNAFIAARYPSVLAEALVDEALTLLWQRRRQRRIFISYRRTESQAMARQLHDHFTERSFAVFLDERSIEPAVDFQHELKRQLDDSDAVLVLISPALTTSRWVREELEFANTRRIGLLGIAWPSVGKKPATGVAPHAVVAQLDRDQKIVLASASDPSVAYELSPDELREVDRMVFEGRSRAIARRTTSLIDEAVPQLEPNFEFVAYRDDGDLELVRVRTGQPWLGRIAPFRPSPYDLWRWWDEIRQRAARPDGIVVIYPHVDPSDPTEKAFRAVCEAWGQHARPQVELRAVHL